MGQTIGLVLAGGEGRRIGSPKGSLVLDGLTLAERAARALKPICGGVLVSIAPGAPNPAAAYPVVEDAAPAGRGPIAGIHAAMGVTGRADLLVLACDYPGVGTDLLRAIAAAARPGDDLVFPTDLVGRDHPLVGLWTRGSEPKIRAAIEHRAYKVRALLADLHVRRLGPADLPGFDLGRALANFNRPEDLPERP